MMIRIFSMVLMLLAMLAPAGIAYAQEDTEGMPPYMRNTQDFDEYDLIEEEELSPIQRVTRELSQQDAPTEVRSLKDIQNLLTFQYTLVGQSEEEIINEAYVNALKSAAGRLYVDEFVLLGRDLLEPYVERNGERFIARTTIVDRRVLDENRLQITLRVSVNLDLYFADLEGKRFIDKPELRPIVVVHLDEKVEGEDDTSKNGRSRFEATLRENLYRVWSDRQRSPALDVDVSDTPELLQEARFEAQRNDAGILITGSLSISENNNQLILFDENYNYNATLNLKMIRVDTGEMLMRIDDEYSAQGDNAEAAIANVLDSLMVRSAQAMADKLKDDWDKTMFDFDGRYRLMFAGVEQGQIEQIHSWLKTEMPDIEIYQKSFYGGVLVLNLVVPEAKEDLLVEYINESTLPQFSVRRLETRKRYELTLL